MFLDAQASLAPTHVSLLVGRWYFWISILSAPLVAQGQKLKKADPNYFSWNWSGGKGGGESLKKIEKYDLRSPLVFTLFCREASVKFPHLELCLCKKNDKYEVCIQVYLLSSDKPKNSRKGQGWERRGHFRIWQRKVNGFLLLNFLRICPENI